VDKPILETALDYSEFSGNRVVLIVNGTLVRLAQGTTKPKRIEDAPG
jgi:S-adenosylhomocysteine hydrolase